MAWPLLALKSLTAAQQIAMLGSEHSAKSTSREMEHVAKEIEQGSKTIKQLVNISEGKPADPTELSLEHPAEAWAHRGDPVWFVGKTVKAGFRAPDGSHEYLWVKVVSSGRAMVGQLLTQPTVLPKKAGSAVTFKAKDIVDVQLGGGSRRRPGRRPA